MKRPSCSGDRRFLLALLPRSHHQALPISKKYMRYDFLDKFGENWRLWAAFVAALPDLESRLHKQQEQRPDRPYETTETLPLCVPKIRFCNIGGEGHRELGMT